MTLKSPRFCTSNAKRQKSAALAPKSQSGTGVQEGAVHSESPRFSRSELLASDAGTRSVPEVAWRTGVPRMATGG